MSHLASFTNKTFSNPIKFNKPSISKNELVSVLNCLIEDELSFGKTGKSFEKEFAKVFYFRHALSLNSLAAAYHLALLSFDIGIDDEVIAGSITPLSLVDAGNLTGSKIIPVDIDKNSFHPSADAITAKITAKTKAILISHTFGSYYSDFKELNKIIEEYQNNNQKIHIIEDFSTMLGQEIGDEYIGHKGKIGIVSFASEMMITSGLGAMICMSDPKLYGKASSLRSTNTRNPGEIRYDYFLTDFQAAMGLEQLSNLSIILERRKKIGQHYCDILRSTKFETYFDDPDTDCYLNFPLVTNLAMERIEHHFKSMQIGIKRITELPLHLFYQLNPLDFPNSERLWQKAVLLPCYPHLSKNNIDRISVAIRNLY